MVNQPLHSDRDSLSTVNVTEIGRAITQWVSFDEPESRLKRFIKRDAALLAPAFKTGFEVSISPDKQDIRANSFKLVALAFVLEDISRFKALAFRRVTRSFEVGKTRGTEQTALLERLFTTSDYLHSIDENLIAGLSSIQKLSKEEVGWANLTVAILSKMFEIASALPPEQVGEVSVFLAVQKTIENNLEKKSDTTGGELITMACDALFSEIHAYGNSLPEEVLPLELLLVEGQTETILLPHFARLLGFDLRKNRILTIGRGGANQVAKRFMHYSDISKLPLICILDGDANDQKEIIEQHLREDDCLHSLEIGEIEDTFDVAVLLKYLNLYSSSMTGEYSPTVLETNELTEKDFPPHLKRTRSLSSIWKHREMGDFDKVEFAEFIVANLTDADEIPSDLARIIEELKLRRNG